MATSVNTLAGANSAEVAAAESEFGNLVEKVTRSDEGMPQQNMSGDQHHSQHPDEALVETVDKAKQGKARP